MDEAFELMLAPRRHRCLGARLDPLTLGHILLLHRLQSPFLTGQPVTAIRLFEAVFVCCQDHRKAESNMQRWWIGTLLWLWGWFHRKTNLETESAKFAAYLDEAFAIPKTKPSKEDKTRSVPGAPWVLRVLVSLMAELHWTEEQALACPLIKANGLITTLSEARGGVKLWTEQDRAFLQWAREQDRMTFANGTP